MAKVLFFKTQMPLIHADVASLFLSNLKKIEDILYWKKPIALTNWCAIRISGKDSKIWLDRQLTQKITDLPQSGRTIARLDRAAHVLYFGVLIPFQDDFKLILPNELRQAFYADAEKFVIMEDVHISSDVDDDLVFRCDSQKPTIDFFGIEGELFQDKDIVSDLELLNDFFAYLGIPRVGIDITGKELVNETRLDELAVNYDKGCFQGQETAAKIRSRRGANNFPVVLTGNLSNVPKIGDVFEDGAKVGRIVDLFQEVETWFANAVLKREWRVLDAKYSFGQVGKAPYINCGSYKSRAKKLYFEAIKDFERHDEDLALKKLKRTVEFDPSLADAYESIGVIYSRHGNYEKTIEWMDKLLSVNSKSVMAHTNKSLAYMKLGDIEKAEAEKAEATLKSFSMYGDEAKAKKEKEEARKKELADMERRESMFRQVLKIDEKDLIALYGLADISFKKENYSESLELVSLALESNPKHSQSLLLLGKSYEMLGKVDEARDVYSKGIKIASAQGELMPANEMQSRLNKLS